MASYLYPLVTILTLPMAVRVGIRMFTARDVSPMEQWARLLVTAAVLAWLVLR
jgi:hypothetical protein